MQNDFNLLVPVVIILFLLLAPGSLSPLMFTLVFIPVSVLGLYFGVREIKSSLEK
ncbi:hypothetical protein JCM19046_2638 [Bacillus sp. JCM 19046]|nr:hypothetical protein JCM19045_798 [Bacillus sp. JCM 19045]GAF18085.1 hypothetical protein JCM19046_2638 [Bacillus sp. JCM 19046]